MRYHQAINMVIPKTTFQAKRIVRFGKRPALIAKPEAKAAKEHIYKNLRNAKPANIIKPPYHICIVFYFLAPKSRIKKCKEVQPMIVKPDIDNLAKGFLDGMVDARWIEKDQQVYRLDLTKFETNNREFVTITIF